SAAGSEAPSLSNEYLSPLLLLSAALSAGESLCVLMASGKDEERRSVVMRVQVCTVLWEWAVETKYEDTKLHSSSSSVAQRSSSPVEISPKSGSVGSSTDIASKTNSFIHGIITSVTLKQILVHILHNLDSLPLKTLTSVPNFPASILPPLSKRVEHVLWGDMIQFCSIFRFNAALTLIEMCGLNKDERVYVTSSLGAAWATVTGEISRYVHVQREKEREEEREEERSGIENHRSIIQSHQQGDQAFKKQSSFLSTASDFHGIGSFINQSPNLFSSILGPVKPIPGSSQLISSTKDISGDSPPTLGSQLESVAMGSVDVTLPTTPREDEIQEDEIQEHQDGKVEKEEGREEEEGRDKEEGEVVDIVPSEPKVSSGSISSPVPDKDDKRINFSDHSERLDTSITLPKRRKRPIEHPFLQQCSQTLARISALNITITSSPKPPAPIPFIWSLSYSAYERGGWVTKSIDDVLVVGVKVRVNLRVKSLVRLRKMTFECEIADIKCRNIFTIEGREKDGDGNEEALSVDSIEGGDALSSSAPSSAMKSSFLARKSLRSHIPREREQEREEEDCTQHESTVHQEDDNDMCPVSPRSCCSSSFPQSSSISPLLLPTFQSCQGSTEFDVTHPTTLRVQMCELRIDDAVLMEIGRYICDGSARECVDPLEGIKIGLAEDGGAVSLSGEEREREEEDCTQHESTVHQEDDNDMCPVSPRSCCSSSFPQSSSISPLLLPTFQSCQGSTEFVVTHPTTLRVQMCELRIDDAVLMEIGRYICDGSARELEKRERGREREREEGKDQGLQGVDELLKRITKWNGKKRGLDTVMDEVKRPRWSGVFVNKASALSRSSSTIGMISSSVDSTGLGAASGSVPRNSTLDNALKHTMASIESPLFLPSPPLVSHHSHEPVVVCACICNNNPVPVNPIQLKASVTGGVCVRIEHDWREEVEKRYEQVWEEGLEDELLLTIPKLDVDQLYVIPFIVTRPIGGGVTINLEVVQKIKKNVSSANLHESKSSLGVSESRIVRTCIALKFIPILKVACAAFCEPVIPYCIKPLPSSHLCPSSSISSFSSLFSSRQGTVEKHTAQPALTRRGAALLYGIQLERYGAAEERKKEKEKEKRDMESEYSFPLMNKKPKESDEEKYLRWEEEREADSKTINVSSVAIISGSETTLSFVDGKVLSGMSYLEDLNLDLRNMLMCSVTKHWPGDDFDDSGLVVDEEDIEAMKTLCMKNFGFCLLPSTHPRLFISVLEQSKLSRVNLLCDQFGLEISTIQTNPTEKDAETVESACCDHIHHDSSHPSPKLKNISHAFQSKHNPMKLSSLLLESLAYISWMEKLPRVKLSPFPVSCALDHPRYVPFGQPFKVVLNIRTYGLPTAPRKAFVSLQHTSSASSPHRSSSPLGPKEKRDVFVCGMQNNTLTIPAIGEKRVEYTIIPISYGFSIKLPIFSIEIEGISPAIQTTGTISVVP
ncbi:hypothetical protein ADUPG1_010872, partial [Aduncisulcus paluster]